MRNRGDGDLGISRRITRDGTGMPTIKTLWACILRNEGSVTGAQRSLLCPPREKKVFKKSSKQNRFVFLQGDMGQ